MGGANDEEDEKNYKKIVKKVASEVIISKNDGEVLTIEDNDDNNHDLLRLMLCNITLSRIGVTLICYYELLFELDYFVS